MGTNAIGSTKIKYITKDKIPVQYLYFDLKGKNRFPSCPENEAQVIADFDRCLQDINLTVQQEEIIKDFNAKYKHRFMVQHRRKVEEYKEKYELKKFRRTDGGNEGFFKEFQDHRKLELQEQMCDLEMNKNSLKMSVTSLDTYITERNADAEFIKIDGVKRMIALLDLAIAANLKGTKTIFQNQIDILKFLKGISDRNSKDYFNAVACIPDYGVVLLRAYHPVSVAVSAYVLVMLQDYAWKAEFSRSLIECLQIFRGETELSSSKSYLQPFGSTIYNTDNIMMCYYNLRFINEALISIVDEEEKKSFEENLRSIKYQLLVEDIKTKLEESFYKLEYCTFIEVNQKIYKYAVRGQDNGDLQGLTLNRGSMTMDGLQQHLYVNFDNSYYGTNDVSEEEVLEGNLIITYLAENDRRTFNRFVLDTFSQIQHFYKYTAIVNDAEQLSESIASQLQQMKKYELTMEEYIKRIRGSCIKNVCEETMLGCLKIIQYFEKAEWKKLEHFLVQEIKTMRIGVDIETLKKQLEQKEDELHNLKKEMMGMKANQLTGSQGMLLPPPPPLNGVLSGAILPPPPSLDFALSGAILPPPPSLDFALSGAILPPPPPIGLLSLPPPPGLPGLPGLPSLPGMPSLPGQPALNVPAVKLKQKVKTKVALKACNYTVLEYQKIANTIWSKVDDTKLKLNEEELTNYFGKAVPKQSSTKATQSKTSQPEVKKKEGIRLIGQDRYRNLEIVLTKLKLPEGAVSQTLIECGGQYAATSTLESIEKILPSDEEQSAVKFFEGNAADLAKPEQFIKEIMSVPEYQNRIKAILFSRVKDELYFELQKKIDDLTKAFDTLKANGKLHCVLETALAVGNHLNGTGLKGGAWGFKLDTIERLEEVKSSDGRMNAGFYVVKEVWKKHKYPIFEKDQVEMIQIISKLPVSQIKVELAELKRYVPALEKALKSKKEGNAKDKIDQCCQKILPEVKNKCTVLQESCKRLEKSYNDCATFYCEDPAKGSSDQIGKRIFKSVLYIFTTEKLYFQLEDKLKKDQIKKAEMLKLSKPEGDKKQLPPNSKGMRMQIPAEVPARLKFVSEQQKLRENKVLQQVMKRRNSKMVAFRSSRQSGLQSFASRKFNDVDLKLMNM